MRNIGTGIADLFRMPYAGLTRGPGAFVTGVSHGMGSLFKHISTGKLSRKSGIIYIKMNPLKFDQGIHS